MERIEDRVKEIISTELGIEMDKVHLNSNFTQDLGVDSLEIMQLLISLEEEFNIKIPDKDIETLATVGDLIQYINDRAKKDVF